MSTPLESWIQELVDLMQPDKVYWCDGSEEETRRLVKIGMEEEKLNGVPVFKELNQDVWPDAYFHKSHPKDVARTEKLTFVCHDKEETAGPNNNWMEPEKAKRKA